jgi:YD repeat-containing protein
LGETRKTEFDDYGRITIKTDATDATTSYSYDQFGNRATITDATGNTYAFIYNDRHLPISLTDPLGQEWRRVYDETNRLIGIIDPLRHSWQIRYDTEGNVTELVSPLGARKTQQYTQGILNAVSDWMGNVTRFRLDPFGRVTERQGPIGEITRFHYDFLGNPVEVMLADDTALRASYDSAGNVTSFTDGNGHTSRFRYGPCQRLLERIDPVGGAVRYVWGSEPGRLEEVTIDGRDAQLEARQVRYADGLGEVDVERIVVDVASEEDRVHFLGFRSDVAELLPLFDLFVLSSREEGISLTLIEAMASGLPIVATRVGGSPEVVIDGETGLLVEAGQPAALAGALGSLLGDPDARMRMGRRGREVALRRFDIERLIDEYQAVYTEIRPGYAGAAARPQL